jgi:hypothetical protein
MAVEGLVFTASARETPKKNSALTAESFILFQDGIV